jgi:ligand-binding SRPBCC domain-containing protein
MKIKTLTKVQFIPIDAGLCWDFFSDPSNLAKITPPSMGFRITSAQTGMYPGQIITYSVRPIAGIPVTWVTEITQVKKGEYFIDEQRFGPYKFWHHKHFFMEVPGGVEMTDIVHYALPLDPFSRIFLPFVKKKLEEIFQFRSKYIEREFTR